MPSTHYFVLPYAETPEGVQTALVQRQLVQWRRHGKRLALPRIPDWAGQWSLSGGKAPMEDPATPTALRLFYEQTGIPLEKEATAYGLREITTEEFRDEALLPFTVAFAKLAPEGLERLRRDIKRNIDDRSLDSDILQHVAVFPQFAARGQLGPADKPKGGWHPFIVRRIFGGQMPGLFNSTQDIYFMQLAKRSAMPSGWFATALKIASGGAAMPTLVGFEILEKAAGGDTFADERTVQVYNPGGAVVIRAVTHPDKPQVHQYITWDGGEKDPEHPHDRRKVRLNRLAPPDSPIIVTAELFGRKKSIEIVILPEFVGLEVDEAEPVAGDLHRAPFSDTEQFVTVRALLNPPTPEAYAQITWKGGLPGPDDARLVSRQRISPRGEPVRVTAMLGETRKAEIEIVPSAIAFGVANARRSGADEWTAEYSRDNVDPVEIVAVTTPDTAAAWSYIEWTGAAPVSASLAVLAVDRLGRGSVTATVPGLTATAHIRVVPRLLGLEPTALVFAESAGGWYSYVGHRPPVIVSARTDPQDAQAQGAIVWHGTDEAYGTGGSRTVARDGEGEKTVTAEIAGAGRLELKIDMRRPGAIDGLRFGLKRIRFVDAKPVVDDFNAARPGIWVHGADDPAPICYVRNRSVTLSPVLSIESPAQSDQSLDIRATAFFLLADGSCKPLVWRWTADVAAGATVDIDLGQTVSDSALPDEVSCQDAGSGSDGYRLAIIWEVKTRASADWTEIAETHHPFYVTLADPLGTVRPYWTELKISCEAANGTRDARTFIERVYEVFTARQDDTGENPRLVATSRTVDDGVKHLTYWRNWNSGGNPGHTDSAMIANDDGNGSCRAFAMMLLNFYRLNGIGSGRIVAVSPNTALSQEAAESGGFLVSNWQFDVLPPTNIDWTLQADAMTNHWENGAGQNQQIPPPAFQNHFIVWNDQTARFYDPSYGSPPQPTEMDWENAAADGLYRKPVPDLGFIKQAPGQPRQILKLVKGPSSLPY